MRKQHLDTFPVAGRLLERLRLGQRPGNVARFLVDAARDFSDGRLWTALCLEQATTTVARFCPIEKCLPVVDQLARRREDLVGGVYKAVEPANRGPKVPELIVDDGEAVMHVGKLSSEREPDLNLRRASPARRAVVFGRYAFAELRLHRILLRLFLVRVGLEPKFTVELNHVRNHLDT